MKLRFVVLWIKQNQDPDVCYALQNYLLTYENNPLLKTVFNRESLFPIIRWLLYNISCHKKPQFQELFIKIQILKGIYKDGWFL